MMPVQLLPRRNVPLHVRWGAVVLDVVGNDTAVGQELIEDGPAPGHGQSRETSGSSGRGATYGTGRAEREATRGADALRQFEEAAGRTSSRPRFKQGKEIGLVR